MCQKEIQDRKDIFSKIFKELLIHPDKKTRFMTQNIFTPNQINEVYLQDIFTLRGMKKIVGKTERSNDELIYLSI